MHLACRCRHHVARCRPFEPVLQLQPPRQPRYSPPRDRPQQPIIGNPQNLGAGAVPTPGPYYHGPSAAAGGPGPAPHAPWAASTPHAPAPQTGLGAYYAAQDAAMAGQADGGSTGPWGYYGGGGAEGDVDVDLDVADGTGAGTVTVRGGTADVVVPGEAFGEQDQHIHVHIHQASGAAERCKTGRAQTFTAAITNGNCR